MAKIIRLTESDLARIVTRIIEEESDPCYNASQKIKLRIGGPPMLDGDPNTEIFFYINKFGVELVLTIKTKDKITLSMSKNTILRQDFVQIFDSLGDVGSTSSSLTVSVPCENVDEFINAYIKFEKVLKNNGFSCPQPQQGNLGPCF